MKTPWINQIAGVVAGRTPESIEMMQVVLGRKSGSALGSLSHTRHE
jgi:hypothetical protein